MTLAQRLADVNARIARAAQSVNRQREDITLVGVCKTVGREVVEAAYQAGLRDFGENRVPDAEEKFAPPPYPGEQGHLHLIGHLQTNKVKRAVALADFIHSVDSLRLAEFISRTAQESGKIMPVLLEVNVSGEMSKHGVTPDQLAGLIEQVAALPNLELRGLMTVAPNLPDPAQTRPVFAGLRTLFEQHSSGLPHWRDLSMGMTNDFEIAIQEGATIVRVGRAIFAEPETSA